MTKGRSTREAKELDISLHITVKQGATALGKKRKVGPIRE